MPLQVLPISAETLSLLNRHILLVYTGTPRLARGLLQDVVRRWHSAQPRCAAATLSPLPLGLS
eukprot:3881440-Pleurochrysis_carterae.AAC.3